jgi:hypothetical protein
VANFFVDFIKSFDTLELYFILNTLKHFGFNNHSFIRWVHTLYADIQTCVWNKGCVSVIFKNFWWIRQKCPLSALLFILSVEIMAFRLRSNKYIKWIAIKINRNNHSTQISRLADDTTLFWLQKKKLHLL